MENVGLGKEASFMIGGDLVRALCIAVMAVPVFTLARISSAADGPEQLGPLQLPVASEQDAAQAFQAMATGEAAENIWFEAEDPIRYSKSFQVQFYETLFGQAWQAQDAVSHLQLASSDDLDPASGEPVLGTNWLGDPFLIDMTAVAEADLSGVPAEDQAAFQSAGISRVWSVEGVCSTELGAITVIASVFFGEIDGVGYWRFIPILDPESEFVERVQSAYATAGGQQGQGAQPAPPVQPYSVCAAVCNIQDNACRQIANNNATGCTAAAAAALALCMLGVAAGLAIPLFGPAAGGAIALGCLGTAATAVAACLVGLATALANCRVEKNACLAACCVNDPDGCPQ